MNQIKIDPERQIRSINPHIFGGFAEHLGRHIYGGIYEPGSPLARWRWTQGRTAGASDYQIFWHIVMPYARYKAWANRITA